MVLQIINICRYTLYFNKWCNTVIGTRYPFGTNRVNIIYIDGQDIISLKTILENNLDNFDEFSMNNLDNNTFNEKVLDKKIQNLKILTNRKQ